jgi:hypothetical protein
MNIIGNLKRAQTLNLHRAPTTAYSMNPAAIFALLYLCRRVMMSTKHCVGLFYNIRELLSAGAVLRHRISHKANASFPRPVPAHGFSFFSFSRRAKRTFVAAACFLFLFFYDNILFFAPAIFRVLQ